MDLKVLLIEVLNAKDLTRPIPPGTSAVVYCVKGDTVSPPRDSVPLLDFSLRPSEFLQKYHLVVKSDFELGFRMCQLQRYQPTVLTSRIDATPFEIVGMTLGDRAARKVERAEGQEEELNQVLLTQLQEKVRSQLVTNPELLLHLKPSSTIAQIKNLAVGVLRSYQSRVRAVTAQLPQPAEMAEIVYSQLASEGVFALQAPAKLASPAPLPEVLSQSTLNAISAIKREGLRNYIDLFLQNPEQRAAKESSARNQFMNLVNGLVSAHRQKGVQNLPDAEKLTVPMFSQLKAIGVLAVQGSVVKYNDEKIEALAGSPPLQQTVTSAEGAPAAVTAAEFRLNVLYRAASAFYSGILTAEDCKGRTESAVKEQLHNVVRHALAGALRDGMKPPASTPQEEDLTNVIFDCLQRTHVFTREGSTLRYSPAQTEEFGRKLSSQSLFVAADVAEPVITQAQKRELLDRVLVEIRDMQGLTLGKLEGICSRKALSFLKFDSRWGEMGADAKPIVADLLRAVVTDGGHAVTLPAEVGLDTVLRDVNNFRELQVSAAPGDIYGDEDMDA